MSISTVTVDDLCRMNGNEGLVLQGCGVFKNGYLSPALTAM